MKSLLKIMITLALFFASTFIILKSTGLITVEKIELWLEMAKRADPLLVGAIIAGLLFADLFIAVPTMTVMVLGGFFPWTNLWSNCRRFRTVSSGNMRVWNKPKIWANLD